MQDQDEVSLPGCCLAAAEAQFRKRFPLQPEDDWLAQHLSSIARKWGKVTQAATEGIYIRTVSDVAFLDARVSPVTCANDHQTKMVLLGSRLYYLAWRVALICSTFWVKQMRGDNTVTLEGRAGSDWPSQRHLDQLHIALRVYMRDEVLSNEGFAELKAFAVEDSPVAMFQQMYVADFALLFLLLHELQHVLVDGLGEKGLLHYKQLVQLEGVSVARAERWGAELTHDANAAWAVLLSASEVLHRKLQMSIDLAKRQAASLVFAGADLVLNMLQFVEERRFGRAVKVGEAVHMREFRTHPPGRYRRDRLSHLSFSAVTGRPIEDLWRGYRGEDWLFVAQNVASLMKVRERLLTAYQHAQMTAYGVPHHA